ncbi:MAG: hypothetical protein R3B54_07150 [Bdellovibrionota bacterium]
MKLGVQFGLSLFLFSSLLLVAGETTSLDPHALKAAGKRPVVAVPEKNPYEELKNPTGRVCLFVDKEGPLLKDWLPANFESHRVNNLEALLNVCADMPDKHCEVVFI